MDLKIRLVDCRTRVGNWDFPLPDDSNVMCWNPLDEDYRMMFRLPKWSSAIVVRDGGFFLFEHNIVGVSDRRWGPQERWYVYPLQSDWVSEIVRTGRIDYWRIRFESASEFGFFYRFESSGGRSECFRYDCPKDSEFLSYPSGMQPTLIKEGESIGGWLRFNSKSSPIEISKSVVRDLVISSILIDKNFIL